MNYGPSSPPVMARQLRGEEMRTEKRKGKENCERNDVILHSGFKAATCRRQPRWLKTIKFISTKITNETKEEGSVVMQLSRLQSRKGNVGGVW